MSYNVSSNYSALFGNRVAPANGPAATPAPAAAMPEQVMDTASISASPQDIANVASVTPSADVRAELIQLRKELMDIEKQLQALMQQAGPVQTSPSVPQPAVASAPSSAVPPTSAPAVASQTSASSYNVKSGDFLWKIAAQQLGDASRWPEIYALNKDVIGDNPNLIQPGQVLRMPAKVNATPATSAQPSRIPTGTVTPVVPVPPLVGPVPGQPVLPQPSPQVPQPLPPLAPPAYSGPGKADVTPKPSNRSLSDLQVFQVGMQFGLMAPNQPITPEAKANVAAFMDELDAYQGEFRGKVFGPGMEALAQNPTEVQAIQRSVQQIQAALGLLIKAGRLHPKLANGQPVMDVPQSGSYFKMDPSGQVMKDAQGQPVMDDVLVAAITQFKQDHGLHQSYRLADGSYGINEYVGPNTVDALKAELQKIQPGKR